MIILNIVSYAVCLLLGAYLIAFGVFAILKPKSAANFLLGFAQNAQLHYLELFVRFTIGWGLIHQSSTMLGSGVVNFVGWTLVGTTTGLSVVPWRWHRRFAQRTVPYANRYLTSISVFSILLGILVWISLPAFV
ncbi:MAG: hypothetical protein E6Q34_08195 [Burkholderiaceae bacterium]|nr:MAG: hypothetical protein E6Q34_08195 [Burkholderiaceae bacterium]